MDISTSETNKKLFEAICSANNLLAEVCHGDYEHQIEYHADTLVEEYRRVAQGAQKALEVLNLIVIEVVGG